MWKKSVCGLTILIAGLLVWSCGDGSVDSLSDNELMMISRFPSTIDYDMLDSVVNACKNDAVCWEKAKKTGEIYKGDYTKVLRDSSGNIVVVEGDSAYIWKDGKKLPVFDFSSNSAGDDDDDVSSSSAATSGSSSRSSSGAGYDTDDYIDDDGSGGGSAGSGTSSRAHVQGSSSSQKGTSSSVDGSMYTNSSSSLGEASSESAEHDRFSSSGITIEGSSVSETSSSDGVIVPSSSSKNVISGPSSAESGKTCETGSLKGVCSANKAEVIVNKPVVYTFVPDAANTCNATNEILWLDYNDGATKESQTGSFTFEQTYTTTGLKKQTYFTMGGERINCQPNYPEVKSECTKANVYSCSIALTSASNNVTKSNPVSYTWTLTKGGCHDVESVLWDGNDLGTEMSFTKNYTSATTASVTLSVVDESGTDPIPVNSCPTGVVRNVVETAPSCQVDGIVAVKGKSFTVTPKTVNGCNYDDDRCDYDLRKNSGGASLASGPRYNGETLSGISGESSAGTVKYKLTLTNKEGSGYCLFDVEYVDAISVEAGVEADNFTSFAAGTYYEVVIGSVVRNGFFCQSETNQGRFAVGVFNGSVINVNDWSGVKVSPGNSYLFHVDDDVPEDLICGVRW